MTRRVFGLGLALVLLVCCERAHAVVGEESASALPESLFPKKFDLPKPLALRLTLQRGRKALLIEQTDEENKVFAKRFVLPAPFPIPSLDSLRPVESTDRFRKKLVMPDPMEKANRAGFKFALFFDKYLLRPIARVWGKIPRPLTAPIVNVGRNLRRPVDFINAVLQGNIRESVKTMFAFLTDSLLGFGGLVAVAKNIGLDDRSEDFGQTLAVYGAGHFAYFPLPFLGPLSVRDGAGRVVDYFLNPFNYVLPIYNQGLSVALGVLSGFDAYARALPLIEAVERNTLDLYAAQRDFYARTRALEVLNVDSRGGLPSPVGFGETDPYEDGDPFAE